jgi:hypothetical protein
VFTGNYPDPLIELNGSTAKPLMWSFPGNPARTNGIIHVRPGHIVGFWNGHDLTHSMIAVTPTSWIGANNTGCFGVSTGRLQIPDVNNLPANETIRNPELKLGWVGNGNEWRAMGGNILTVTHRLPFRQQFR